jgi:hypothetical protein
MRTARSRTSGENLFVLFMAPFSQELEPPQAKSRAVQGDIEALVIQQIQEALKTKR